MQRHPPFRPWLLHPLLSWVAQMAATPAAADVVRQCGGVRSVLAAVGFDFSKGAVRKGHTSDASDQGASDGHPNGAIIGNVCTATTAAAAAAVPVDASGQLSDADSFHGSPAAVETVTVGEFSTTLYFSPVCATQQFMKLSSTAKVFQGSNSLSGLWLGQDAMHLGLGWNLFYTYITTSSNGNGLLCKTMSIEGGIRLTPCIRSSEHTQKVHRFASND